MRPAAGRGSQGAWAAAAVFAVTAAVCSPVLKNGFVNWDDGPALVENVHFRSLSRDEILWNFTHFHMGTYSPLSWTAFGAIHTIQGELDPRGYHLASLLTFSLSAALLTLIFSRLLEASADPGELPGKIPGALSACAGALLFSLHPMQAAGIAMASALSDLAACALTLGAVLAYLRWADSRRPLLRWLLVSWALAALSPMCRWQGVGLPATLLILDLYPLRRLPPDPRDWVRAGNWPVLVEKIPFFIISGGTALFNSWAKMSQSGYATTTFQPRAIAGAAVLFAGKFLLPLGLEPEYRFPPGGPGPHGWPSWADLSAVAAAAAALWYFRKRLPAALAVGTHYLLVLIPPFLLARPGVVFAYDRYPCLGYAAFGALAAGGLARVWGAPGRGRLKILSGILVLAVGFVLAGLTRDELRGWRDSVTLWTKHLEANPRAFVARNNLGATLFEVGRKDEALYFFLEEAELHPGEALVRKNLKLAREALGRRLPDLPTVHNNQGADLLREGRLRESLWRLGSAAALSPNMARAHLNLGLVFTALGEKTRARAHLERSLALDPGLTDARLVLDRSSTRR